MHALEQLASQFTLAELADRAGITLTELLARTLGRGVTQAKISNAERAKSSKTSQHRGRSAPDPALDAAVLAVLRTAKDRVPVSALTTDPKIAALMSKSGGRIAETIARLIEAGHSISIEGQTRARTYKLVRG